MTYKRYVSFTLLLVFCLFGTVSVFTYRMDPGNIFENDQLVKDCGNWLIEGHDVAVTQNFIDRQLQKYLIMHDDKEYDVLVFGSSRTMPIGEELFPGNSMRNYSVSAATLEDAIALYFLYERYHQQPKKVVFGIDAWFFARGYEGWKELLADYAYGKARLAGGEMKTNPNFETTYLWFEKYTQLVSWPYFMTSVKKCKQLLQSGEKKGYYIVEDRATFPENVSYMHSDGSRISADDILVTDEEASVAARRFVSNSEMATLGRYDELRKMELQSFLSYLRSQDVDVVLYFTPYHPIAYSYVEQKYPKILEAERFFQELASDYHFSVVGAYNPQICGLSEKDFRDGIHLRREAVNRILGGKL